MLKIVKFGGVTLSSGVVIGLGVVGWLWLHRPDTTVVNSKGGIVTGLNDDEPTPTPDPNNLSVAQPLGGGLGTVLGSGSSTSGNTPANAGGGAATGSRGGSGDGSGAGEATGGSSAGLSALVPSEFKQYEQFREQGQIYEVQPGTGAEVKAGSMVTVNYRGWLTNGQLFDESYSRGQPFVFKEGEHRVISGWEQGLLGAKAGAKRRLVLPPAFGYGDQAHDPIPANSMLIFDVEVVAVQ